MQYTVQYMQEYILIMSRVARTPESKSPVERLSIPRLTPSRHRLVRLTHSHFLSPLSPRHCLRYSHYRSLLDTPFINSRRGIWGSLPVLICISTAADPESVLACNVIRAVRTISICLRPRGADISDASRAVLSLRPEYSVGTKT